MTEAKCVADFMVRDPACAETWQPVALARHRVLISSFSYLPIQLNGQWKLISDYAIASYVAAQHDPRQALKKTIESLCDAGTLVLEDAPVVRPDASIREALEMSRGKPVLVIEGGRMVGIATPFDLL